MKKIIWAFVLIFLVKAAGYGQSLNLSKIDPSNFPFVKAKLFAVDPSGAQIKGLTAKDISITENGLPREVISISCPPDKPPEKVSLTLIIDRSRSMEGAPFKIAKMVARTWVNALPYPQFECAVLSFDDKSYLNQDLTNSKTKLLDAIDKIVASDGKTEYNEAFLKLPAGGIPIAKAGKYKRIIVFITDGEPSDIPDDIQIAAQANANSITIHCIAIQLPGHESMKKIARLTGGMSFDNVETEEQAESIAELLLVNSVFGEPCEIIWKSDLACDLSDRLVVAKWSALTTSVGYAPPPESHATIEIDPYNVFFLNKPIGVKFDTTFSVAALNSDLIITEFQTSNPNFSVSPTSLSINKGDVKEFTLSYIPPDSGSYFTTIRAKFITPDSSLPCYQDLYVKAGYQDYKPDSYSLKVVFPNGREKIVVGSDTLIKWTGVFPTDTVSIQYSSDNGRTWRLLTDNATGFQYNWKNVLKPVSDNCLVKISTNQRQKEPLAHWEKLYGGNDKESLYSIKQTKNGKYIAVGETNSKDGDVTDYHGLSDAWITYLESDGSIIWQKSLGGMFNDNATAVVERDEGGYIIGGSTESPEVVDQPDTVLGKDFWIIKLDAGGEIELSKAYGGSGEEELNSFDRTADDGLILAGTTNSNDLDVSGNHGSTDAWIVKLDRAGAIEWQKCLGGKNEDGANSVLQTDDGGYLVAGYSYSVDGNISDNNGVSDCWLIKLSRDGDVEWSKTFGGAGGETIRSIRAARDGGFVFAGYSQSFNGDIPYNRGKKDALIGKLDKSGKLEWIKPIGGSKDDEANDIIQTVDDEYIFVGSTYSSDGDVNKPSLSPYSKFWIVKYDPESGIRWQKIYEDVSNSAAYSVSVTKDVGCVAGGFAPKASNSDFAIKKLGFDFPPQTDISDTLFSIVAPSTKSFDLDLGQVSLSEELDSTVVSYVVNNGSYDCKINKIWIKGEHKDDFQVVTNAPFVLKPGEKRDINFFFKPKDLGFRNALVEIDTQDSIIIQKIVGEGVQPAVEILTDMIDFGRALTGTKRDTAVVIIKNLSSSPVDVLETKMLGPDLAQFEILAGGAPFRLSGYGEKEMKIRFKPNAIGRTSSEIGFMCEGMNSPLRAVLFGEGLGGRVICSKDTAFPGEKVEYELKYDIISPEELKAGINSFKARLKYLKSLMTPVDNSIIVKETADSAEIEVAGPIGYAGKLKTIEFISNKSGAKFTDLNIEELKWFDLSGNEIDFVTENENGNFKLLDRTSSVHCTDDSAYVGEKIDIKLILDDYFPAELPAKAASFKAVLRYLKGPLDITDKSLLIQETADSTTIGITSSAHASSELYSIGFNAAQSSKKFTNLDIMDFQWLDKDGNEIITEKTIKSGSFKLLSSSLLVYCTEDSAYAGERAIVKIMKSVGGPRQISDFASSFVATIRYQASLLTLTDKSIPVTIKGDSAYATITGGVGPESLLFNLEFIAGLGSAESTSIDLIDFKWLDDKGAVINYETALQSGLFRLLGVCEEGGARLFNPSGVSGIIQLNPNPASSKELIATVEQIEDGDSFIYIYNALGNEVSKTKLPEKAIGKTDIKLNILNLSPGIYFIKYQTPTTSDARKLIVE